MVCCFALGHLAAASQISVRALFLGNSYTYANDLPFLISKIASSKGDTLIYDSNTPGGYRFQDHCSNTTSRNKIASGNWDVVVLQEQSQLPSFPPSQVQTDVYPWADTLVRLIRLADECTSPLLFMTWGRKNGDASNCASWPPVCTFLGMQERLRFSYLEMSQMFSSPVSPVGAAFKQLRSSWPGIELYSPDESHPSLAGSYLAACTFYCGIFRKTPLSAYFPAGISPSDALILQNVAAQIVFDSLPVWNIDTSVVRAECTWTQTGQDFTFFNHSSNADSFFWDFGDGTYSTDPAPAHSYAGTGLFHLLFTACNQANCFCDTADYWLNALASASSGGILSGVKVFPSPAQDFLNVRLAPGSTGTYQLFNNQGLLIRSGSLNSENKLNVSDAGQGVYVLIICTGLYCHYHRFAIVR